VDPGLGSPVAERTLSLTSTQVLAQGLAGPRGIAVDSATVYFATYDDRTVRSVPIGGGPIRTLATAADPVGAVAVTQAVYFSTVVTGGGAVWSVPRDGGTADLLAGGLSAPTWSLALVDTVAFWVDVRGGIRSATGDGAANNLGQAGGAEGSMWSATDGSRIYFTTTDGLVQSVSIAGGSPTTLATSAVTDGTALLGGIAVSGGYVYWADTAAGTLQRVDVAGAGPVETLGAASAPTAVGVDDTGVYYLNLGTNGGGGIGGYHKNGSVERIPPTGGAAVVLADGLDYPFALALDGTSVYVTVRGGGHVLQVAKN
jgi:hypothetical protein